MLAVRFMIASGGVYAPRVCFSTVLALPRYFFKAFVSLVSIVAATQ